MPEPASLKERIRAEAERLGFVACGFARADAVLTQQPEAEDTQRSCCVFQRRADD